MPLPFLTRHIRAISVRAARSTDARAFCRRARSDNGHVAGAIKKGTVDSNWPSHRHPFLMPAGATPLHSGLKASGTIRDGVCLLAATAAGFVAFGVPALHASSAWGCHYIDSSRWKNDRYRVSAMRRFSVDTLLPFVHCPSSVERSRVNTSVNRVITWDTNASACSTAARG
jgi:hypothetical protein